ACSTRARSGWSSSWSARRPSMVAACSTWDAGAEARWRWLAERFGALATGVDLSPEAVAFCQRTHRHPAIRFEIGDAEHLPFEAPSSDVVTNTESPHTSPTLRAFFAEVRRVLVTGGWFLYPDLLPVARWMEVRALLGPLGFPVVADRLITLNVLAS